MLVKMDNGHRRQTERDTGMGDERNSNIQDPPPGVVDPRNGRTWGQQQEHNDMLQSVAGLTWLQNALLATRGDEFPISLASQHHAQHLTPQQGISYGQVPSSSHMDEQSAGVPRSSLNLSSVSSAAMELRRHAEYMSSIGQSSFLPLSRAKQGTIIEELQKLHSGSGTQSNSIGMASFGHAVASSCLNNEEAINRRFQNGATLVPCRARGMPKDHAKNGCLIVPNNVQHGEGLLCSHTHCQNKGIRFVYCAVCEHPVAKFNFTTRHKHLEVFKPPQAGTIPQRAGEKHSKKKGGKKTSVNKVEANKGEQPVCVPSSGSRKRSQERTDQNEVSEEKPPSSKLQKKRTGHKTASCDTTPMIQPKICWMHDQNVGDGGNKFSSDPSSVQRIMTAGCNSHAVSLVGSSADTSSKASDSMLDAVCHASKNLAKSNTASSSFSSSIQYHQHGDTTGDTIIEQEWLSLLKERPASKNTEQMKAWIQNIIQTSENHGVVATMRQPSSADDDDDDNDDYGSVSSSTAGGGEKNDDANPKGIDSDFIIDEATFSKNMQNELSSVSSSRIEEDDKVEDDDGDHSTTSCNSNDKVGGMK